MSLVPCRACGSEVPIPTAGCPTCGAAAARSPRTNAMVVLALAGLGVCISGILIPLLL